MIMDVVTAPSTAQYLHPSPQAGNTLKGLGHQKWSASSTKDANGNYVHIIGREAGLIAWLPSLILIDPITLLEITDRVVMFAQGSLEGSKKRVIPLGSTCSSYY